MNQAAHWRIYFKGFVLKSWLITNCTNLVIVNYVDILFQNLDLSLNAYVSIAATTQYRIT